MESKTKHTSVFGLGFGLRIVQAAFLFQVLAIYGQAALTAPAYFTYDFSLFRALFETVFSVISIWLIARRAHIARTFILAGIPTAGLFMLLDICLFGAGPQIVSVLGATGTKALIGFQIVLWISIWLFVAFSKRARKKLNVSIRNITAAEKYLLAQEPMKKRMRTWPFWRDMIMYFIMFSFLGHWAEMLFCLLIEAGVFMGDFDLGNTMLWDQWLYPFSAEGIALILIVLILYPFKEWLLKRTGGRIAIALPVSFAINAIVCTSIDFTTGITANADYSLWDYRALPFNFMGQIVLQNSLVYSIAATLVVWVIYPLMDRIMAHLPRWFADALFWTLASAYVFLALLHFMYLGPQGFVFG